MPKKSQVDKFREAAREVDADESERKFDKALKRVANRKPRDEPKESENKKT